MVIVNWKKSLQLFSYNVTFIYLVYAHLQWWENMLESLKTTGSRFYGDFLVNACLIPANGVAMATL